MLNIETLIAVAASSFATGVLATVAVVWGMKMLDNYYANKK